MNGTDDLRASDSDRDRVAELVRQAAMEGRLDFEEMEERLGRVFTAKTYGELAVLTRDLPGSEVAEPQGKASSAPVARPGPSHINAIFGEEKVKGAWLVPPHMRVRSTFGEVVLDLTEATVPHEVIIDAQVILGELNLIVPEGIAVVFEHGQTLFGSRTNKTQTPATPGTPVVRVRASVFLGEAVARPPRTRWFRR